MDRGDPARYIDHTLLRADATAAQIDRLCAEAREHRFAAVCVNSSHVARCVREVAGSGVRVCAVAGFPLGASCTDVKIAEVRCAVGAGADEVDVVANVGLLIDGDEAAYAGELSRIRDACPGRVLKVIIETWVLTDDLKRRAARLVSDSGADFVKTSSGFGPTGATEEDVRLLCSSVTAGVGVKASGGIRTLEAVERMLDAGASRIGTSSSVDIVAEWRRRRSGIQTQREVDHEY